VNVVVGANEIMSIASKNNERTNVILGRKHSRMSGININSAWIKREQATFSHIAMAAVASKD